MGHKWGSALWNNLFKFIYRTLTAKIIHHHILNKIKLKVIRNISMIKPRSGQAETRLALALEQACSLLCLISERFLLLLSRLYPPPLPLRKKPLRF